MPPEQRHSPPRGRAEPGAGGQHEQHTSTRPWSEGFPALDERQVLAAITNADIRTLARSLDEGAFRNDHGDHGFRCVRCGYWSAEVLSDALWWCNGCDRPGTRYELAHFVACDAFASVRLARLAGVLR